MRLFWQTEQCLLLTVQENIKIVPCHFFECPKARKYVAVHNSTAADLFLAERLKLHCERVAPPADRRYNFSSFFGRLAFDGGKRHLRVFEDTLFEKDSDFFMFFLVS